MGRAKIEDGKANYTFRYRKSVIKTFQNMEIKGLADKVRAAMDQIIISEKITRLEVTDAKYEAFRDIKDALYSIEVDGNTIESIIPMNLYMDIMKNCMYKLPLHKRTTEEMKMLYFNALTAINEFLNSDQGVYRDLFKSLHAGLYEELQGLTAEI